MKATENKLLPSKYYYISIGFLGLISLLFYLSRGWVEAALFIPYILLIYIIGRNYQEKQNPDKIS